MLKQFSIASIIAVGLYLPVGASASQLSGIAQEPPSAATPVQFWDIGRCRSWRRECADRWGWRTERFHGCLVRHGCERHRYDDEYDRPLRRGY
jgi:hypothetical protein